MDTYAADVSLRAQYDAIDWDRTPLGPRAGWSSALRSALDLALQTRFPVTLLWGPELVLLYNHAYVQLISDKHPAALGAPARDVFPEAWDTIGPLLHSVLAGGGATWLEDVRLPLHRRGFLEECFFTFSYSPVHADDGTVEGVLAIATETTTQVVDRRRLELLVQLGEQLGDVQDLPDLVRRALRVLRAASHDLPAVDLRLPGLSGGRSDPRLPVDPPSGWTAQDLHVAPTPDGQVAWLPLSSTLEPAAPGALVVLLSQQLRPEGPYLETLRLVGTTLVAALHRVQAREVERREAAAERDLSETLQRSLLTQPLQPDHLQVAVRYAPAAEQAQIGGDWYDAFLLPDGALSVVVGDVAGHDRQAAAAMAQVRNLLRGTAYALQRSPAGVLVGLDRAMHGLAADVIASVVLARVEQDEEQARSDLRTLRWSNAGHPPPVLLPPDGRARLLETSPELLLGLLPDGERKDYTLLIEPGASVVFYTDGLVERRDRALDVGLTRLVQVLEGQQDRTAEELCDLLLTAFEDGFAEDDVVLLVLKAWPQDGPRPERAGSRTSPSDLRTGG